VNSIQRVDNWLEKSGPKLLELLPGNIDQDRFLRNVSSQVKMNPAIQRCRPDTIINSIIRATHLGLDIGVLGSAWIVPYGDQANLVIGYAGLIDLANRSGTVNAIHSGVVRQNDYYKRTEDNFSHDYDAFASTETRGPVVGCYCLVDLKNGSRQIETMNLEDIEQVRSGSRSGNNGPWVQYFEEMSKKSVIRRALKRIKLSPELQEAIQSSDDAEFLSSEVQPPKKRGAVNLMDRLDKAAPVQQEPRVVDAVVTAVEEPEAPQEPPQEPVKDTPKNSDYSVGDPVSAGAVDWVAHLRLAKDVALKIGAPVRKWYKITPLRQKMIKERAKTEGISASDAQAFWDLVEETFVPFDASKVEDWKDNCDLDILLRIPKRGGKDHFTAAREGAYRGKTEEAPKFSVADMAD